MHVTVPTLLVLQCTLGLCIRVPVVWNNDNSEVNNNQFAVEAVPPRNTGNNQKPIPAEYFQYTAQKPKFAADIAQFHGVKSPENHYKAYPIKPHTGVAKPELGKHQMLNEEKTNFRPYQDYVQKNEAVHHVTPSSTSYEVFHPYKLEEPALKELYQDPVMDKIRNDLLNSKNRLQKYENEAGEPDITKSEYLESPEETDRKKVPHRNVPAPYEIHRPQRRPVYYRPPALHNHREHALNQKLRHPWHQNYVKVKPMHYRPVKNHLQRLRQQHALKYDDEHNEYPQVPPPEKYSEPSDGYDIYEKGKAKFVQLRNNVDESINEAVQKNRPVVSQNLELSNEKSNEDASTEEQEDEFVPIKNYAQVRKTETTKHLPKAAAFYDADTLDEIRNAPRLREAIKSTKAQTVYSEEGYEDAAYDHAGEQKHASDHEGHGGFLKENELSAGKFKTPSFSAKYEDGESSEYRDQVLDGKKWKDNNKDTKEEVDSDDYSEDEQEHSDEVDVYSHKPINNKNGETSEVKNINTLEEESNERIKREETPSQASKDKTSTDKNKVSEHGVNKREAELEVPEINLNSTYLTEKDILNLAKLKVLPKIKENTSEKYPYYFKKIKSVSKDSPLRYAENLQLIPKKSKGGTEFYDSRSTFECPEVDDDVDPVPDKLKKDGHPDENEDDNEEDTDKDKADFNELENKRRLSGLGDKIDCFKAKYFGENPLDSPFFKEEVISNPEPIIVPSIEIYRLKQKKEQIAQEPKPNKEVDLSTELSDKGKIDMFTLLEKLNPKQVIHTNGAQINNNKSVEAQPNNTTLESKVTSSSNIRKRRAAPFVYEPYKIIRDGQVQDSKKTTTTNNISPLIKQLQSSRVVDRVATNHGKDPVVKRNVGTRTYKDIGKSDREKNINKAKGSQPVSDASFVDVSIDQRRGEPKYELRPANHKSVYIPVEDKKSMSVDDYKAQLKTDLSSEDYDLSDNKKEATREIKSTIRPFFDVTKFLPHREEKIIEPQSRSDKSFEDSDSDEEYEEYDSDNEQTTTTTIKAPPKRRRISTSSTTVKPVKEDNEPFTEVPKLRLVTRFRNSYQTEKPKVNVKPQTEKSTTEAFEEDITAPKYREKKKKSTKSTVVTDTKSYGEDDDDNLRKEEVDAMIGVKHDIKEYMPLYEKEIKKKKSNSDTSSENEDDEDYEEHSRHESEDEDDDDDEDDEDDEEDDEDDDEEDDEESENQEERKLDVTTPEPSKRTLTYTTESPPATTEARSAKLEVKPVVVKKKLEIHKELPVNRSSPHITEFKQDIKEVEIIKEIPSKTKKKPQKNIEALELYKDENLPKDVNKLGGVEIFKEGLDLVSGPKHGGNYRSAEVIKDETPSSSLRKKNQKNIRGDVIASQSKTSKQIEVTDDPYSRRRSDIQRARNNRGRSAKFIELSESIEKTTSKPMHGGNLRSIKDERRSGRRGGSRNAKIIELDEHKSNEDDSTDSYGGDFKSYGSDDSNRHSMHGGNYRSAKIVQADDTEETTSTKGGNINKKDTSKDGKRKAAAFLSSIASAVPILTTTPAYILDPSKRMYYYVDA